MRPDGDVHVEVAWHRALWPRLAFAGQAYAHPVLDTGGDLHLQAAFTLHGPVALADPARVADDFSGAAASRAHALDQEEALLCPDLSGPAAGLAVLGVALLALGAGAGAGVA